MRAWLLPTVAPALVACSILGGAAPAPALAVADPSPLITSVELVPAPGTTFSYDDRTYAGVLRVGAGADGIVLTEEVGLDGYLEGIGEVPFSWPMETLSAQAVAARTYLAYTLAGGRSGDGAAYGFDICASSACQVYAGSGQASADGGPRWIEAVERTAGEILLYQGTPAQAVYSSSTGPRTRSNQDIWGGAAIPYLQAVDSPEAGVSPFASWVVDIPADLFVTILERDGYDVSGDLQSILVRDPGEGAGPTSIWVDTVGGTDVVAETDLKGAFNRQGPELAPGLLPMRIGDGRRLPQALPSYTYEITFVAGAPSQVVATAAPRLPEDDRPSTGKVVIEGEGWGHGVGMSQWGAKALGDSGATYQEILAHYYGGLTPVAGDGHMPEEVVVGLAWELGEATIVADGLFELRANGVAVAVLSGGTWVFRRPGGGGLAIVPPQEREAELGVVLGGRHWAR